MIDRSGVLADFSVHSFVNLGLNGFLLSFLALVMLIGYGLLAVRWRAIPGPQEPLGSFSHDGPFFDMSVPTDVNVTRQVLAEPTVDLAAKTWARLTDGTPLVKVIEAVGSIPGIKVDLGAKPLALCPGRQ